MRFQRNRGTDDTITKQYRYEVRRKKDLVLSKSVVCVGENKKCSGNVIKSWGTFGCILYTQCVLYNVVLMANPDDIDIPKSKRVLTY